MIRCWVLALGAAVLALGMTGAVRATSTRSFSENADTLARGRADGVAVTSNGRLFPAPGVSRLGNDPMPGNPAHVWSLAEDGRGNTYLGTGPDGTIVRISATGKRELFFRVDEPLVTALAVTADGFVLAGTSPGGRIWRIDASGRGEVWSETETRYVWDLVARPDGTVFAATGEDGAVLTIPRDGTPRKFFDADEAHIVALDLAEDGTLIAGGAGFGLLYRIDPDGNAVVLYDDDLSEVAGVAADADGTVWAALVAEPAPASRRPSVRIELPAGATPGPTGDSVSAPGGENTLRGVIEGLPSDADRRSSVQQGRVIRVAPDGSAKVLWRSNVEAPFALARDASGRVVFGTGEPARLYRIEEDDDIALLASLDEAQITCAHRIGRSIAVATSNPAAAYLVGASNETGTFVSRTFDAGAPARWGSIHWEVEGTPSRAEIYTRTGNSERPDETWSAWSPALADPRGSTIVNPDGRFLQWRARFTQPRDAATRVWGVELKYEPFNREPTLRDFFLEGKSLAVSGDATFRFAATDPDDDPVAVRLTLRGRDATDWTAVPGPDEDESRATWDDDRVVLHTADLDEGEYVVRVTVDDQAGNPPGAAHRIVAREGLWFTIDRTPPRIELGPAGDGGIEITVADDHSDVDRVELVRGGRVHFSLRPVDGVCDSRREVFRLAAADFPEGEGWSARGIDRAGNTVEAPLSR